MTNPRIEKVDCALPDKGVVTQAATVLTESGLVVAPTETRYGLLSRADQLSTLEKMYRVKNRSFAVPTAIFVDSINRIAQYGEINNTATRIIDKFLPGPLTLVLNTIKDFGQPLVVDGKIGIRWSSAPFIEMLLKKTDFPITATSANPSGGIECDTVEHISQLWGTDIDLYVDGGRLSNKGSTVIDVSSGSLTILRKGAVSVSDIENIFRNQLI